ncbi:MAG: succinate dehydrogenase, cytochrome b556 subunit [Gammaproteobacteria bacterium]
MSRFDRPISPHLQIYRWTLTMTLSILHRATGVALSVGLLLLVSWIVSAAAGPERFGAVQAFIAGPLGLTLLFGWTLALFFHMANGIRHLFWDIGVGYDLPVAYASGWATLAFTALATTIAWGVGLGWLGGGA